MKNILKDERGTGELEVLAIIMVIAMCGAFGYGIVRGIYELCCSVPPPPKSLEVVWKEQQQEECRSMRSGFSYDEKTRIAKCYRTPMLRKPIKMFERKFAGE